MQTIEDLGRALQGMNPGQFAGTDPAALEAQLKKQFPDRFGQYLDLPAPDAIEKAVNYRTGNGLVDIPLSVVQGAAKGVLSTAITGGSVLRKALGMPQIDPDDVRHLTQADGLGQGAGKTVEQIAEFAVPGAAASRALKGASLVAKTGTLAGIGAGVAGLQTGGDPKSMAIAGGLGAAGEAIPAYAQSLQGSSSPAEDAVGKAAMKWGGHKVGAVAGGLVAGPIGGMIGGLLGGHILSDVSSSGVLEDLGAARLQGLVDALKIGDKTAAMQMLKQGAVAGTQSLSTKKTSN